MAKTSATVHAGGAGGVVVAGSASIRAKRTSDSDSSCEIVNVYSSAEGGGKATSHGVNNGSSSAGSRKNNSSEGGGSDLRTSSSNSARGGGGSTAAVQPIDANDIDVNQIMQDLKVSGEGGRGRRPFSVLFFGLNSIEVGLWRIFSLNIEKQKRFY